MSNARNLASLLGTGSTIPTAKIADNAVTAVKLNSTLDLSSKSLTMPSGIAAFKRAYNGRNTSANGFQFSTSHQTLCSIPNVVVNAGEKVWLSYHMTVRASGNCQVHAAVVPHYSGSATGYVGDSNWGVGIHDFQSHAQWNMMTGFVSLSDYGTGGGGPFGSTGTFTFDLKVRSTNTTGFFGSENPNVNVSYTPLMGTILVG